MGKHRKQEKAATLEIDLMEEISRLNQVLFEIKQKNSKGTTDAHDPDKVLALKVQIGMLWLKVDGVL